MATEKRCKKLKKIALTLSIILSSPYFNAFGAENDEAIQIESMSEAELGDINAEIVSFGDYLLEQSEEKNYLEHINSIVPLKKKATKNEMLLELFFSTCLRVLRDTDNDNIRFHMCHTLLKNEAQDLPYLDEIMPIAVDLIIRIPDSGKKFILIKDISNRCNESHTAIIRRIKETLRTENFMSLQSTLYVSGIIDAYMYFGNIFFLEYSGFIRRSYQQLTPKEKIDLIEKVRDGVTGFSQEVRSRCEELYQIMRPEIAEYNRSIDESCRYERLEREQRLERQRQRLEHERLERLERERLERLQRERLERFVLEDIEREREGRERLERERLVELGRRLRLERLEREISELGRPFTRLERAERECSEYEERERAREFRLEHERFVLADFERARLGHERLGRELSERLERGLCLESELLEHERLGRELSERERLERERFERERLELERLELERQEAVNLERYRRHHNGADFVRDPMMEQMMEQAMIDPGIPPPPNHRLEQPKQHPSKFAGKNSRTL